MDALTVAFTKDVFIQYFNNKNASLKPDTNEIQKSISHRRCGSKYNHDHNHQTAAFLTAPVKLSLIHI